MKLPSIAYVVARSYPQHIIGCENKLPWKLSTDLKFFRKITVDHAVIMGRKTFDSIGHPLKDRLNVVISRQPGNDGPSLRWVDNKEDALFSADLYSILNQKKQVLIIGGAEIYKVFHRLVNKVFLTEVFHHFERGDAFFAENFDRRKWKTLDEQEYPASNQDEFPFRISVLERRLKTVRQLDISEFLLRGHLEAHWLAAQVSERAAALEHLAEEQYQLPALGARHP